MRTVFICPFDLERLTGTPLRAKVGIDSVSQFAETFVIATRGRPFDNKARFEFIQTRKLFGFSKETFRKLRSIKPNVVHSITTVSIIPMLLYKLFYNRKVKIIFELHGWAWYETEGKLSLLKRLVFLCLDFAGLWFSNVVITVSDTEKQFIFPKVWRKNKIQSIWDPVDFLLDYKMPEKRPYTKVGYIGNSERWQGLPALIKAAEILKYNNQIIFEIAGFDSSDDSKFPKLQNIRYTRRVERVDVPTFLQDCDILVSSRLKEKVSDLQFPHKLSEYLAVGRPVIVSKASDQPFVTESGKCGFILSDVSGFEISETIKKFVLLSEEKKIQMGKNAREFCKNNLYKDVFYKKLKSVYDGLFA